MKHLSTNQVLLNVIRDSKHDPSKAQNFIDLIDPVTPNETFELNRMLIEAAYVGSLRIVEYLIAKGVSVNISSPRSGGTALHWAAMAGQVSIVKFLLEKGADHAAVNKQGDTPLDQALEENHFEVAKILLDADDLGQESLFWTVYRKGKERVAELLLTYDFVLTYPIMERFFFDSYLKPVEAQERRRLLQLFFEKKQSQDLEQLLPDHRNVLLYAAAKVENIVFMKCLIDKGATLDVRGLTIPRWGFLVGKPEVMRLLLEKDLLDVNSELPMLAEFSCTQTLSLLTLAVMHNYTETVELALKYRVNAHLDPNERYQTPLYTAISHKKTEIVKLFFRYGARITEGSNNEFYAICNQTILEHALSMGDYDVLAQILDQLSVFKRYPTPLYQVVYQNGINLTQSFLQKGAHVNPPPGITWLDTPLHAAVRHRNSEMTALLLEAKAKVNACDAKGVTPLWEAANQNDTHLVRVLLQKGAHVNSPPGITWLDTPLHAAVRHRNSQVIALLLEAKAKVNACNAKGVTPLWKAVVIEDLDIVQWLVSEGACVNEALLNSSEKWKSTPLHAATATKNIPIVRFLLQKKADVNILDDHNVTPLHLAIENASHYGEDWVNPEGYTEKFKQELIIVELLLQAKAQVNPAVGVNWPYTPLHCAVKNMDLIRILLKHGADIHARDDQGKTPLCRVIYHPINAFTQFLQQGSSIIEYLVQNSKDAKIAQEILRKKLEHVVATDARSIHELETIRSLIAARIDIGSVEKQAHLRTFLSQPVRHVSHENRREVFEKTLSLWTQSMLMGFKTRFDFEGEAQDPLESIEDIQLREAVKARRALIEEAYVGMRIPMEDPSDGLRACFYAFNQRKRLTAIFKDTPETRHIRLWRQILFHPNPVVIPQALDEKGEALGQALQNVAKEAAARVTTAANIKKLLPPELQDMIIQWLIQPFKLQNFTEELNWDLDLSVSLEVVSTLYGGFSLPSRLPQLYVDHFSSAPNVWDRIAQEAFNGLSPLHP